MPLVIEMKSWFVPVAAMVRPGTVCDRAVRVVVAIMPKTPAIVTHWLLMVFI